MTQNSKQKFLTKLETLAQALYKKGDSVSHSGSWESKKSFIGGFVDAGLTLSLVTIEEVQTAIDEAHLGVYGEERLARIKRWETSLGEDDEVIWDLLDEPAFERMKRKPNKTRED